jgi:RHS repeat-associated protein
MSVKFSDCFNPIFLYIKIRFKSPFILKAFLSFRTGSDTVVNIFQKLILGITFSLYAITAHAGIYSMDAYQLFYTSELGQPRFVSPQEAVDSFITWCNDYFTNYWICTSDGAYKKVIYWSYDYRLTGIGSNEGLVYDYIDMGLGPDYSCPEGYTRNSRECYIDSSVPKTEDPGCGNGTWAGNPVDVTLGTKKEQEVDLIANGNFPLRFERTYRSRPRSDVLTSKYFHYALGSRWTHTYERYVSYTAPYSLGPNGPVSAVVARESGHVYIFTQTSDPNIYTADYGTSNVLTKLDDGSGNFAGWQFINSNDEVEIYDVSGRIISITDKHGNTQTLTYNQGVLEKVETNSGEYISFAYDANNRIDFITDQSGRQWQYKYDTNGNLEFVLYPDDTPGDETDNPRRQYHYNEPQNTSGVDQPYALTGITDERGNRYATWQYDAQGRATASYHGPETTILNDRIEGVSILYNSDGSRDITNSRGNTSIYSTTTQLSVGLVTDITGPGCTTCGSGNTSYIYDPSNNYLLSKTKNGITTQYGDYDNKGNNGYMIEAFGTTEERRTDYTYDPRFDSKVLTKTESSVYAAGSKITTYSYDDYGNTASITINGFKPDGTAVSRTTTMQYNGPMNQISQINGPRTDVTDVTDLEYYSYTPNPQVFDPNNGRLLRVIGPDAGNGRIIMRDNIQYTATGKVLSEDRPNGLNMSYTYTPRDWLETLTQTSGGVSRTTRWTYLPTGEVQTITIAYGTADATTLTFGYDAARRLTSITDGLGNYIEYILDTEGNMEEEKSYDPLGVLKTQLSQTFDVYNRLDVSSQVNESLNYDFAPDGTLDKVTDSNNVVSDLGYDALKRLITATQDLGGTDTTTQDALTQNGYDAQDNLTSVTDPNGNTTSYVYDDLGNLLSQTSPDTGTRTYTYDGAGNIKTYLDANGNSFTYSYDALNRLTLIDAPGTTDDISYGYDTCANGVGYTCVITQDSTTVNYVYNGFGEAINHQGIQYSFDNAGRVQTITYPSGAIITYSYDAAGQVSQVDLTQGGNITTLVSNLSYAPFGPLKDMSYGNGLSLSQQLDMAYRTQSIDFVGSSVSFSNYVYDGNGNITNRSVDIQAEVYSYDALNRLDIASGVFGDRDYSYDKNGNRTNKISDANTTDYSYVLGSNRLETETGWTYTLDNNGNTTHKLLDSGTGEGFVYSYNAYNRLVEFSEAVLTQIKVKGQWVTVVSNNLLASYTYNGLGQRISKDVNGANTQFTYGLSGELLTEQTGTDGKEYIYLNGQLLAVLASGQTNPSSEEVILDDGDTGTSSTGTWSVQSDRKGKDYQGDHLLANGGTGSTYRWTPSLGGGTYDVYARWISDRKNSSNVPYSIFHNGSTDISYQDQTGSNGQWVLLGSYVFNGDGTEYIEVSDANGQTVADAARFVKQTAPQSITALYYVHNDQLGTPQAMSDDTGTLVWRASYDPFGKATVNEDPDGDNNSITLNIRFPGQYYDAETGLHYNYHRYYSPQEGRYLTSDPIGLRGGLNTYLYANANPLRFIDPEGLAIWEVIDAFEAGMVAGVGGQYVIYKLQSPCNSQGKKYTITVHAVGPSAGLGLKCKACFTAPVKVPFGGAFDDHSGEPNPGAFDGPYLSVNAGAQAFGFGGSSSDVLLGRATSVGSLGTSIGFGTFGAEVSGTIGTSTVMDVKTEDCGCEK